jgi:hypothetical protein
MTYGITPSLYSFSYLPSFIFSAVLFKFDFLTWVFQALNCHLARLSEKFWQNCTTLALTGFSVDGAKLQAGCSALS